jgi:hypothetical protein
MIPWDNEPRERKEFGHSGAGGMFMFAVAFFMLLVYIVTEGM